MWPAQQLSWAAHLSWDDEQPPPPTPDIRFGKILSACARELIGFRLVTTYRDFVRFVPRRLDQGAFQPGEWPLDPLLSWDEIAEAIINEQTMFRCRDEVTDDYPWLKAIDAVGRMLGGVHGLVLSDEIVGVSQPERVHYSRSAIRHLVDSDSWSFLAGRLSADKVLVPLAFRPDEGAAEAEFARVINALQEQYFDFISESPPGFAQGFLLKGELAESQESPGINRNGDDNDDDGDNGGLDSSANLGHDAGMPKIGVE